MNEFLSDVLQPFALTVIEAAFAAFVPAAFWYARQWMAARVHDARFRCAMEKISTYAEIAVLEVGNLYCKEARRTEFWTNEKGVAAKVRARAVFERLVGPAGLKELQRCLGHTPDGVEAVTDGALERAVALAKYHRMLPEGGRRLSPASTSER